MATGKNVLLGACGIGAATMCCLLVAIGYIINDIQTLKSELNVEIDAFKVKANDLWKDMVSMGAAPRKRRQYPSESDGSTYDQGKGQKYTGPKGPPRATPDSFGKEAPNRGGPKFAHAKHQGGAGRGGAGGAGPSSNVGYGNYGAAGGRGAIRNGSRYGNGKTTSDVERGGDGGSYVESVGEATSGPATIEQPGTGSHVSESASGAVVSGGGTSEANECPAGVQGPKGEPGMDGMDGMDGLDGPDGVDAEDAQAQMQQLDNCFHCPPGPPGEAGPPGRPGPRGMRGARGHDGIPGRDGQPGFPGQMGLEGPPGPPGDEGPQGEPGKHAEHIVGRKGAEGPQGPVGPAGEQGEEGEPGPQGSTGPPGERGPVGEKGDDGAQGEQGDPGEEGMPGSDGEYCPCPGRSSIVSSNHDGAGGGGVRGGGAHDRGGVERNELHGTGRIRPPAPPNQEY